MSHYYDSEKEYGFDGEAPEIETPVNPTADPVIVRLMEKHQESIDGGVLRVVQEDREELYELLSDEKVALRAEEISSRTIRILAFRWLFAKFFFRPLSFRVQSPGSLAHQALDYALRLLPCPAAPSPPAPPLPTGFVSSGVFSQVAINCASMVDASLFTGVRIEVSKDLFSSDARVLGGADTAVAPVVAVIESTVQDSSPTEAGKEAMLSKRQRKTAKKKAKKKATAQAAAGICEGLPLGSSKPLSSSVLVAEHSDCAALGPGTSAVG